ncbi:hypothetical protein [Burkholderia anthina]|uniref:hypothetical protein n=1 Tax=Burkholderia anthina TaxID=179879 RepID=UPI000F5A0B37|nr:hypothetical protein [Burkholderia anthina]
MKRFAESDNRKQIALLPERLDDFLAEDGPIRQPLDLPQMRTSHDPSKMNAPIGKEATDRQRDNG